MRHDIIPGGWWCDNTPDGFSVCLVGSQLRTHFGSVPLPPNSGLGVLYVRIDPVTGRRFVGQGHDGDWQDCGAYWDGERWHNRGKEYGVSPLAFDDVGEIHYRPHQGIRYIEGSGLTVRVYTGDETYAGEVAQWTGLRNGITIGQSYVRHDAATFVTPQGRFVLLNAPCEGIRASRNGSTIAVACWTRVPREAHFFWLDVSEIAGLPRERVEPPPPPPPPPPEDPMAVPNRSAEAAAFLTPRLWWVPSDHAVTMAATFGAVNALCLQFRQTDPRWFLLVKHNHQANVRLRGVDVLLYQISATEAQVVDVVADSDGHDGPPHPIWQVKDIRLISQARMPFPDDEPEPPPDDELEDARRRIAELEAKVRELETRPRVAYTYDEMMAFKDRIVAAYREGTLGREQGDMPSATFSHLLWRWIVEGYSAADLVEDARRRGNGDVPD